MDLKKAEKSINEAYENNKLTKSCLDQAKIMYFNFEINRSIQKR